MKTGRFFLAMVLVCLWATFSSAEMTAEEAAAALAEESEAYCASTVTGRPTDPAIITKKVDEACVLLEKEGTAAFPQFQGKGSPFLFEGTYIWIHTLAESRMLMHPIKYKMVGRELVGLRDKHGKAFFVTMNDLVRERGAGWVEYQWPIPGSDEFTRKISYVKKCTMADGVEVVIGCGLYSYSDEDVAKLDVQ